MKNSPFQKSIFISIIGHIAAFSIFSLSFGNKLSPADYTQVSFLGRILNSYDFTSHPPLDKQGIRKVFQAPSGIETSLINKLYSGGGKQVETEYLTVSNYYFKPTVNLTLDKTKTTFTPKLDLQTPGARRKESTVMLHPVMPYHFSLYFLDRQIAHIEVMFNIVSRRGANSIVVKRKISSGNLEVDLLSMRYISHYLFIQRAKFASDKWQTAKIEFSPKEND